MSEEDDDDDDIDEMVQTLTWIWFNTTASRDALQINIDQFEDMLELIEKICIGSWIFILKAHIRGWQTDIRSAEDQAPDVDDTLGARLC